MTRAKLRQVMQERREMKRRGPAWQGEFMMLTRVAKKYILSIKRVPVVQWEEIIGWDL